MTVDDCEVIFGKRWNLWTHEEKREFARVLEIQDLSYYFYIDIAIEFLADVSSEVRSFVVDCLHDGQERVVN